MRKTIDKEVEIALKKLGYNRDWLNFGIYSKDYLLNQLQIFQNSEDKNTEHYRHKSFTDFLKNRSYLNNVEVDNCINLKDEGVDAFDLHENRIYELIKFPHLY